MTQKACDTHSKMKKLINAVDIARHPFFVNEKKHRSMYLSNAFTLLGHYVETKSEIKKRAL